MSKKLSKYDIVQELIDCGKNDFILTEKQQIALAKVLMEWHNSIYERKKGLFYVHNTIVKELGEWYDYFGYEVSYEVPFSLGDNEKVRFDIVVSKRKEEIIIEVKDSFNKRDFGQVHYYSNILEKAKIKGKLYLAVDFMNFPEAINDNTATGEIVKEIMEEEGIGLIFVDKKVLLICENYEQLQLIKMPDLYYDDEE